MEGQSRRDLLRVAAAVAIVPAADIRVAAQPKTAGQPRPLFFTAREFGMVDELVEIIIPTDDHSPGAKAAGVAAVIDKDLAESFEEAPKEEWRDGLKLVDKISHEMHKTAFLDSTPEQRVAVVSRMARNEADPKKPEELFFHRLKGRTAHAYYSSKIGIHQDIEYKGNSILEDFVGFDAGLVQIGSAK